MGEIEENWQTAKFYCSEIKLICSIGHVFMEVKLDVSICLFQQPAYTKTACQIVILHHPYEGTMISHKNPH